MTITLQVLCIESSEASRSIVAAEVKKAIQAATMGEIRNLAVDPQDGSFVLKGCCHAFHCRKDAIDAAKLQIRNAVYNGLIPDATLTDLIEVRKPSLEDS